MCVDTYSIVDNCHTQKHHSFTKSHLYCFCCPLWFVWAWNPLITTAIHKSTHMYARPAKLFLVSCSSAKKFYARPAKLFLVSCSSAKKSPCEGASDLSPVHPCHIHSSVSNILHDLYYIRLCVCMHQNRCDHPRLVPSTLRRSCENFAALQSGSTTCAPSSLSRFSVPSSFLNRLDKYARN